MFLEGGMGAGRQKEVRKTRWETGEDGGVKLNAAGCDERVEIVEAV